MNGNSNQPIKCLITDDSTTGSTGEVSATGKRANGLQREPDTPNFRENAVNTILIDSGKKILSKGIAQYGDLTGNYILQEQINLASQIAGYIGSIAVGGYVGMVSVGIDIGAKIVSEITSSRKETQNINLTKSILGDVSTRGGR